MTEEEIENLIDQYEDGKPGGVGDLFGLLDVRKEGITLDQIFKLFDNRIRHVPIINDKNELVDVLSYNYYQNIPVAEPFYRLQLLQSKRCS